MFNIQKIKYDKTITIPNSPGVYENNLIYDDFTLTLIDTINTTSLKSLNKYGSGIVQTNILYDSEIPITSMEVYDITDVLINTKSLIDISFDDGSTWNTGYNQGMIYPSNFNISGTRYKLKLKFNNSSEYTNVTNKMKGFIVQINPKNTNLDNFPLQIISTSKITSNNLITDYFINDISLIDTPNTTSLKILNKYGTGIIQTNILYDSFDPIKHLIIYDITEGFIPTKSNIDISFDNGLTWDINNSQGISYNIPSSSYNNYSSVTLSSSGWSTTSSLNSGVSCQAGCGDINNALNFGADYFNEKLSESVWSTFANCNNSNWYNCGCGDVNNALSFCGYGHQVGTYYGINLPLHNTDNWNGLVWVTKSALNLARVFASGCGTGDDALCYGGYTNYPEVYNEKWDGSVWVTTTSLNLGSSHGAGFGDISGALSISGGPEGYYSYSSVQKWIGSIWVTTSSLNIGRVALSGFGDINEGLIFGGQDESVVFISPSEIYNGSIWATTSNITETKNYPSGCGSPTSGGLCIGGLTPLGVNLPTTEKFHKTSVIGHKYQLKVKFNNGEIYGISSSSWSTTSSLISVRTNNFGFGDINNCLSFGGSTAATGTSVVTERWSGSNWATTSNMNVVRSSASGFGTISSGLAFGSITSKSTEIWSGSSWATTANLNINKCESSGCGSTSIGLAFGGFTSTTGATSVNSTEKWNGTSWATTSGLNYIKSYASGCGDINFALSFGGTSTAVTTYLNITEKWIGSIWVTTTALNNSKYGLKGCGNINYTLSFGGYTGAIVKTSEAWTSNVWITTSNINTVRYRFGGCGTAYNALAFGGNSAAVIKTTEKWYAPNNKMCGFVCKIN